MKKELSMIVPVLALGLLLAQPALFAADEQKAPAAAKTIEITPEAVPAVEPVVPEEENQDVKTLNEAADKLQASDPALAKRLRDLAEDLSW